MNDETILTANADGEEKKPEKKPKKKRPKDGKSALSLLLTFLLGLAGGLLGAALVLWFFPGDAAKKDEAPAVIAPGVVNVLPPETAAPQDQTDAPQTQDEDGTGNDAAEPPAGDLPTPGQIYAMAVPSTVGLRATRTEETTGFFGKKSSREAVATGSGFAVRQGGYIVTNYHVVKDAHTIRVTTYNGVGVEAQLLGTDPTCDVAVLRIDAALPAVTLGSAASLSVGDKIYVVGNPLSDLAYTFTDGIVSYKNRVILGADEQLINTFQTNAAINEGNSGGPVFDEKGALVGIATAKYAASSIEGLGFCIPVDGVLSSVNEIIETGGVAAKPSLGLSAQSVTAGMASEQGLPAGCYVVFVEEGSPADEAGIQVGDVIVQADSAAVPTVNALSAVLSSKKIGDSVSLKISRNGASFVYSLTLAERASAEKRTANAYAIDY